MCSEIGIPIALDKTEWAAIRIVFLGILLDGEHLRLGVPLEKKNRALHLLYGMLDHKKATVKELQALCGYLNFLSKAIFPSRTFTRRMYSKFGQVMDLPSRRSKYNKHIQTSSFKLKQHHHVRLDGEFKKDCEIWTRFLEMDEVSVVNRSMVDILGSELMSRDIKFCSDASAAKIWGSAAFLTNVVLKEPGKQVS